LLFEILNILASFIVATGYLNQSLQLCHNGRLFFEGSSIAVDQNAKLFE